MTKHILAIGHGDRIEVNPELCKHEQTVIIKTGKQWTVLGEAADDMDTFEQCLLCAWVMQGDRTWGPMHEEIKSEIPF
jgi:hypothetical protein